ncbi:GGDEF domain-containing protein [Undibacterium squillarum]|uniref:diguanylate cyclase n=1 Tax=Undibacterium squillarum TaxID=1131567 RepID=A0ABQ2Y4S1_9BURK|nr:GGDEF domain-containing protein [Undibacterium squillarum]GGX53394.1 GGDEF domain-containing protein [Undibacterium squillarum]
MTEQLNLTEMAGEGLLENPYLLVALFDQHDILRAANPPFCETYGGRTDGSMSWQQLMRENYEQQRGVRIRADDIDAWIRSAYSRRGKEAFRGFEADLTDGRWIWMTETLLPNRWMLCIGMDITHQRQEGRELRHARDLALREASTDVLTGISNRRAMMRLLQQRVQESQEVNAPLHIALIDIDHFKAVNDTYGHATGDQVLIHFSRTLQACIRREDACGRVGGEEFLLLLPGLETTQAQQICERILERLRKSRPLPALPDFRYSASVGLTRLHVHTEVNHLLALADDALYTAKRSGRDRVVLRLPDDVTSL